MCVWVENSQPAPGPGHGERGNFSTSSWCYFVNKWIINRNLFPFLLLLGGAQSGWRTLARNTFPIMAASECGNPFSRINTMKWTRAVRKLCFPPLERKSRASYLQKSPLKSSLENKLWELGACGGAEIRWERGFLPPSGGESHCSLSPWPPGARGREGPASDPLCPPSWSRRLGSGFPLSRSSRPAWHGPGDALRPVCEVPARCRGLYKPAYYYHNTPP